MIFNPNDRDNHVPFNIEHLSNQIIRSLTQLHEEKDMVAHYTRQLLVNPMNQCIRKTNLRSSHSKVHIGDNKWETHHDKEVYPKLVADVSNRLSEHMNQEKTKVHIHRNTYNRLIQFLECFADYGYCAEDELEHKIPMDFRELIQRAKAIAFDMTKEINEDIKNDV